MLKSEKQVAQAQLKSEKAVIKELEKQYKQAIDEIDEKIASLLGRDDANMQNVIYQVQYQRQLKTQVQSILEQLQANEFETISQFLTQSYTDGYVGAMYSMHSQGVPIISPIDQNAVIKAIQTDSKLNHDLYTELGVDITKLKKTVTSEITRGIATGMMYDDIARNISLATKAPLSRTKTIVRTESHRIQQASAHDAYMVAKSKGADVVKQWDSTLDGDTRPLHQQLDGQIVELEEPFKAGGMTAMYPGDFGDPAQDCNCRCRVNQRAKWALGKEELQTLKDRANYFGLDKSDSLADFKKKYMKAAEPLENTTKSGIIKSRSTLKGIGLQFFATTPEINAKKVAKFIEELQKGNINLTIRKRKQAEHIEGTKDRESRIKRDEDTGKMSTYFYEGTDVEELISGVIGTGRIVFDSETSPFPVEFVSFDKYVGKAYNFGEGKYVDVKRIGIQYGSKGVHAYPVKDW